MARQGVRVRQHAYLAVHPTGVVVALQEVVAEKRYPVRNGSVQGVRTEVGQCLAYWLLKKNFLYKNELIVEMLLERSVITG